MDDDDGDESSSPTPPSSSTGSLMAVRSAGEAGNGCFATPTSPSCPSGGGAAFIEAGTTVLEGLMPLVWAVNDEYESRNCRHCLRPCLPTPPSSPQGQSPSSPLPPPRNCPTCLRSVLCSACSVPTAVAPASRGVGANGGCGSGDGDGSGVERGRHHGSSECQALVRLSTLQEEQPDLAGSLLGGSTIYLRLLLRLLAMRAQERERSSSSPQGGDADVAEHRQSLSDMDDLEDHLEDLLDGGEMEARMGNTIQAARAVAPAAWKANQDTCAEFLGKLYCNSMTIGRAGFSAPLARRRYWSGIRGCLYADFGVGLFPAGAMFNHSCRPNCSWSTVIPAAEDASGSSVPAVSTSAADRAGMAPMLRVVVLENIPAGSQLFISYVDILQPPPVRKELLRRHFFFECACPRCCRRRRRRGPSGSPRARKRTLSRAGNGKTENGGGGNPGSTVDAGGGSSGPALRDGDGGVGVGGGGGGGGGDTDELVSGGWICPERSCCGFGRVLPPLLSAGAGGRGGGGDSSLGDESSMMLDEHRERHGTEGDESQGDEQEEDSEETEESEGEEEETEESEGEEEDGGCELLRGRCSSCGARTGEGYFDRWTDLLRKRLSAADRDMDSGRVRKGRRGLAGVQAACDRRLAPHHAFSLGVHCRLSLAAAVDQDWEATVAHAERALHCIQGLLAGVGAAVAPGTTGGGGGGGGGGRYHRDEGCDRNHAPGMTGEGVVDGGESDRVGAEVLGVGGGSGDRGGDDNVVASRRGRKRGRDGVGGGGGGGTRGSGGSPARVAPDVPVQASAVIWEAILVEVLDRALPLAGRGHERETELHRSRVRSAERAASVLGLERSSLVTLL